MADPYAYLGEGHLGNFYLGNEYVPTDYMGGRRRAGGVSGMGHLGTT